MATFTELRNHLGRLAAILWNYGASFPVPTLDRYEDTSNLGFTFAADLAGSDVPGPAIIRLSEIWVPGPSPDAFTREEYEYEFVERPRNRRRAFHSTDVDFYARAYGVLVHEHCEEILGAPACDHYYGLPVTAYEAIDRFTSTWSQAGPLGCATLRCM
ncbi:MAG: hypothetical protein IVW53_02150 [Chloroflexi bacterium]|nr:hypothetical protein [Chloroflexota bacterium]